MAPIPKTMRGILVEKTGGVDVLQYRESLPVPQPKDNEVLVRNAVSGVNYIDTYFRTGLYSSPKPEILGREGAGHIAAPPSATVAAQYPALTAGAHVVALGSAFYAEYTAVPADSVFPVPAGLSSEAACAAVLQGLTALVLITEAYAVRAGDWVLVPAAAGGVGSLLVQLLTARGARVIASASTPAKRDQATKFGAAVAVGYDGVLEAVRERTGGQGVAAVLDGVGKATWPTAMEAVARKGTIVSFGNASGAVEPVALASLAPKGIKVCRPSFYAFFVTREEKEGYMKELWRVLEKGELQVPVHKTYALTDVAQAHTDLEGRKTTGKLLLQI